MLLLMHITVAHVGSRTGARDSFEPQVEDYLGRCSGFAHCGTEVFKTEQALLEWLDKRQGRTPVLAVMLDSRGKQMSSESFAAWLGARRDEGLQNVVFAIGPADGWSDATRKRAQMLLSFGSMTLAHSLARLVMAEQIYRAVTILTGHPYHGGH
jgi:23S rRNA (pseudouridine1915-N3)-methyltransferase